MQYYTFCPNSYSPKPEELTLRNRCFEFWHKIWKEVYTKSGSLGSFRKDNFFRQHIVSAITNGEEIVALHFYTFFNLNCKIAQNHSYFHFYDEKYINALKSRDVEKVMTLEFMTLNPKYRKSKQQVHIAYALGHLASRFFKNTNSDAVIAPARKDLGVHKMCYQGGFECIQKNVVQRNILCDMVALFPDGYIPPKNPDIKELVDGLIENVIDFTKESHNEKHLKVAS